MMLATVNFEMAGRPFVATLTESGWSIDRIDLSVVGILDMLCAPTDADPAIADPIVMAANRAAEILGGEVEYIRPVTEWVDI